MLKAQEFRLLVRKVMYPVEYLDSFEKMYDEQLPPKPAFYSKLTHSYISDKHNVDSQKVSDTFNLGAMRSYHNLYMMSMLHPSPHLMIFVKAVIILQMILNYIAIIP